MKAALKIVFLVLCLSSTACSDRVTQQVYEPGDPVSYQLFYDRLSPYGLWINYSPYGYVWMPDAGWGFRPYVTAGHWVYTHYGWTWYSYYPWGWAPFHYGRWHFDAFYGWMWVPDTYWAPAWVVWRMGNGYCGWAPMSPQVSVHAVVKSDYSIPREQWVFVRDRDMAKRSIDRYRVDESKNSTLLENAALVRQTRDHRNVVYLPGPDKKTMEQVLNRPIQPKEIRESGKPGSRLTQSEYEIFKPNVQKENLRMHTPAPDRVFDLRDVNHGWEVHRNVNPPRGNPYRYRQNVQPRPQPQRRNISPLEDLRKGNPRKKKGDN
jgi:hypothetical protein